MNKAYTARIFRIDRLDTHNGPGYRTVIFMKGCPLSCDWCHNPEGINQQKEVWYFSKKCIGCETCIGECPEEALSMGFNGIEIDRVKCNGCQLCVEVCPSGALVKLGEDVTAGEMMHKILQDKLFYESSGGGVTITGGEPGMYPLFIAELFRKCRRKNIHTAFDTSGYLSENALLQILPYTDLIFFDLKIMNSKKAEELTGYSSDKILENLGKLRQYIEIHGKPDIIFRTPVVPGSTDSNQNLEKIAEIIKKDFKDLSSGWELCMFNDLSEDKYLRMNRRWNYSGRKCSAADLERMNLIREKYPELKIEITGYISR